jgi:hypothetical protein
VLSFLARVNYQIRLSARVDYYIRLSSDGGVGITQLGLTKMGVWE